ncbi:inorganic phosphate transporter [Blattabacterium cuenoti]|uniref:inorganic phosphate transporter n=1 Tax=Blattabacterium cuenoti TaxID=1653831 RepID=UPI00163BFAC7|nr:inorganic phosphate transporter [Blattabacterium cuenoti]
MKLFYPLIIVIIFILSIFDLIVGLINDAVNFLNSAIGSKVASRKTIMIFASLGILFGSFLSSGMMEVARKGVFDPSYFYLSDLIFIFLAVMISDIILLDIFNTLGLPTSTTVSMVFCLLGGAFSIAIIKMSSPLCNEPLHHLSNYIKAEQTLTIGIGIFLSILISFTSGSLIHYFIRLLFSFEYKSKLPCIGVIWSAMSLSSMTYFLIFKGIHRVMEEHLTKIDFLIHPFIMCIHHQFYIVLFLLFCTWLLVSKLLVSLGYNILKFVVLYGTFSLAMAFSGNDLVNFIGIPIASIQSYNIWTSAGCPPADKFNMTSLSGKVAVPSLILIFSGVIMILTLWFSKKTKKISSTELNLSRKHEEHDHYNDTCLSNFVSREIVRFFLFVGKTFFNLFSKRFLVKIEKNFKQKIQKDESIAFDLVRASSNLTISSILISIATVHKLPLSTTFVTFMVSMGTSFSDRAWDRETAVYRVSGVLKVIRGWFVTGLIAFTMSGITATILYFFKEWAIIFFLCLITFVVYRSYKTYQKTSYQKVREKTSILKNGNLTLETTLKNYSDILEIMISSIETIYQSSIEGIINNNLKNLRYNRTKFLELQENLKHIQNSLIRVIETSTKPYYGILYMRIYNTIKELVYSSDILTNQTLCHVINSHKPIKIWQKNNLIILQHLIINYFKIIIHEINYKTYKKNNAIKIKIFQHIESQMNQQGIGIINHKYGKKNTLLMLDILIQSKSITENLEKILLLYLNGLSIDVYKKKYATFIV